MPLSPHLPRTRKPIPLVASYCRHPDSWKNADSSVVEKSSSSYSDREPRYKFPMRQKGWSIFVVTSPSEKLQAEFKRLVKKWEEETFHLSSLSKIYAHPAYQRIMAMGTAGIPLVLRAVQKGQGHWFYALKYMAGEDKSAGSDNFKDAQAAWLKWGKDEKHI